MAKNEITYYIEQEIAVLSTRGSWSLELNRVSWNGAPPKYDIRTWNEDHSRMGKGVSLNQEEMDNLLAVFAKDEEEED